MRAYQLKLTIKNTKPPIWRRCIIPGGITFSQLSVILNEVVGWEEQGFFVFDFFHRKRKLWEKEMAADKRFPSTSLWKQKMRCRAEDEVLEASETFVDEFLDTEAWFSYSLENGCDHRVDVEQVINDCPFAYPLVEKYKGLCPKEAGGYNLEEVNQRLKERYTVTYQKEMKNFKTLGELQEEQKKGQYGLEGCLCSKGNGSTALRQQEASIEEKGISLEEALEAYTKADLLSYAKELRLGNVSGLSKRELARRLARELTASETMEKRTGILTDDQIALFEKIAGSAEGFFPKEEQQGDVEVLYDMDYLVRYEDGPVLVPKELKRAYEAINTPDFQKKRQQVVWVAACLRTAADFYGVAPIEVVEQLCKKRPEYMTDEWKLSDTYQAIPEEKNPCCLENGKMIHKLLMRDKLYMSLEKSQGRKDFYIPSVEEIKSYGTHGYCAWEASYQKLKTFFGEDLELSCQETEELLREIGQQLSMGYDLMRVIKSICEEKLVFPNPESMNRFCGLMTEVNNHTRMIVHRGHMPCEIVKKAGTKGNRKVRQNGTKLYPNDPCPCGSGKKYKKCCGKK